MPPGKTPQAYLEELTWRHADARYPDGVPAKVRALLEKELALIARLDYARYFLTVYDIVRYAREQKHPLPGPRLGRQQRRVLLPRHHRVDPTRIDLLFERFISADRREPPDIDVDFEHERREEVIQYLYARYGRERAAICSTVIHYRPRMAVREVGKALGLKEDVTAALAGLVWGTGDDEFPEAHVREAGLDPANPAIRQAIALANTLLGFPRHLSQHVGGFVLTRERLDETVPIHNGAMPDRTFLEWDKDDIDALGMLKVDVLALGMLTAIRKSFDLIERHYGRALTLATVPAEDRQVYEMLCKADSVGVFQVESRAQMSMLPRLKPRLLLRSRHRGGDRPPRPDPGRHGASLPAPARRHRAGRIPFPRRCAPCSARRWACRCSRSRRCRSPSSRPASRPTRPTSCAAPWPPSATSAPSTPSARSSSPAWSATATSREFAERCFSQIEGFGEYGFPESHAASFALLVYVSSWIKRYYPEAFCAALLNSQPMGFYAAGAAGARRPRARRRGAPPRPQRQRLGLHAGACFSLSPLAVLHIIALAKSARGLRERAGVRAATNSSTRRGFPSPLGERT